MGVTVTTPATSFDLTTYGLVALELGLVAGDTTLQARIETLIAEVSDEIARACGREFARQTYTETLAGEGGAILFLTHRPLVSITSLSYSGTAAAITEYGIASADVAMVQPLSSGLPGGWWHHTGGSPLYTVVYVAGYLLPGQVGENLPPALRRIATEAVAYRHTNAGRDLAVSSRRMGDLAITYRDGKDDAGLPADIVRRLAPFKGRRFV